MNKRKIHVSKFASILIFLVLILVRPGGWLAAGQQDNVQNIKTESKASPAENLSFHDFFEPSAKTLKPTAKLLSLNGKRVRLVGFMAYMEQPQLGGFYIAPQPVFCDEEGGGNADLPPESVLVKMNSASGKAVKFIPGALEVTGILQIQNSQISLVLDGPQPDSKSVEPKLDEKK